MDDQTVDDQTGRDASHECSVCGGTGDAQFCGSLHGQDGCAKHYCCHCEQTKDENYSIGFCPVCLGSGRISDVMPARDALADAETLQQLADDMPCRCGDSDVCDCEAAQANALAHDARAVFRAVPGLRGE